VEDLVALSRYLKDNYTDAELRMARYIFETDLLTYSVPLNKGKPGDVDSNISKASNVLELSYLKFCAKKFDDGDNMLERIFLFFVGYPLREYKNSWKLNLNNIEADLHARCSYCEVDVKSCPFKLYSYISKCLTDNGRDVRTFFSELLDENVIFNKDENLIKTLAADVQAKIGKYQGNAIDLVGAQMLINTDSIQLVSEKEDKLLYRHLDYNVTTNSFFNNLNEWYKGKVFINKELEINDMKFGDIDSYIFKKSIFDIAAYLKYIAYKNNVDENDIVDAILSNDGFKETEFRMAYYNQYMHQVDALECGENEKECIREILTYIRNYYSNVDLPYIHFNVALYTKNSLLSDEIIGILNRYMRTFNYITNKGTLWVDTEMLVKRTKDSSDMIYQVEKMYNDNDIIIFENIEKIRSLNEFRVDAFFTAIEKFNNKNTKSMTIMVGDRNEIADIAKNHPSIGSVIFNKKINLDNYNSETVLNKIVKKLENVANVDDKFKEVLKEYIEKTYNPKALDEQTYINKTTEQILFDKYDTLETSKKFEKKDIPEVTNGRKKEEILRDLDELVGLTDVKSSVEELLHFLEYKKKLEEQETKELPEGDKPEDNNKTSNSLNLNMLFKGNSGTGKTTVAKLMAELFYTLGFIKENKVVEVTSKDLIAVHLGETAPKTQAVIDSALDGVLFIDEAYTIAMSKGTSNYSAECIATLAKAMEIYHDRLIVIFAGYTKEMNDFINTNQGLMSRIGYELEFPDFSKTELWTIFENQAKKQKFKLEDGVKEKIEKIINRNKVGRNFGNARFVTNLFDRLVIIHASNFTDESDLKIITNKDVDTYEMTKKDKSRTVDEILEELNSLIGLAKVKETIGGFISVIELNRKLNRIPDFNMHMIFKGNAGTGKTTVARLLAEVYYNLGYIKRNKLVEVQSQDLIGEFLGQTGPKTQAVIESALDGVLFIDEAYSIMEHNGTNASYSAECVATLLKAMEDYQGRLIIIFAGYTEEMRKFRDLNPGLKSRVGYEIDFEDYSVDELLEIFEKKVHDKKFKVDDEAKKVVRKIFEDAKQVENFGNGRFVENTVQKVIIEHAKNTRKVEDEERLLTFTKEDIPEIKAEESKKRIGF